MYLEELDLQYLINSVRSVCGKPIFILNPNWSVISCTHQGFTEYAQEIAAFCASDNDYGAAASRFGIIIEPCILEETLICYFMILDKKSGYLIPYLKTLTELLISPQISDIQNQTASSRSMLINQIANTGQKSPEIDTFMKEFEYSYDCPRCALLFEINRHGKEHSHYRFDSSESYLKQLITSSSLYSEEDIYGFLSSDRYLIFKDTSFASTMSVREINDYADSMVTSFRDYNGEELHCTIGSTYTDLYKLRQSYLEALFLIANYDYLNVESSHALNIHDFIFEYAVSLIPRSYWNNRFQNLAQDLGSSPALMETALALSRENLNLSQAAKALGLHRNTLLQRFAKIKSRTKLNPLENDHDRMVLRAFSLYQNQKITLQAGIVIQPNSVLHQGMQKMADLVNKNSCGTININIHTLSTSGNNAHLFEILRSGSIDLVVAATGVMNKFTNNRSRVLEFPFLFQSSAEAKHILNTIIIKDVEHSLDSIGVKCLNIWTMGWRYLTSKEPIRLPQDMAGKKVRVMFTESLDEYYRNMGAVPIKMNYGDVKDALHSGIIDCQENPYSNTLGMKFYEEQDFITRLKYYLSTEALYISKTAWERLSPSQQDIIAAAARETTDWIFTEQQYVINQQCKNILLTEKGMHIIEVSAGEAKLWKSYSQNLYASFPHQDLLKEIEKEKTEYNAKHRALPSL